MKVEEAFFCVLVNDWSGCNLVQVYSVWAIGLGTHSRPPVCVRAVSTISTTWQSVLPVSGDAIVPIENCVDEPQYDG